MLLLTHSSLKNKCYFCKKDISVTLKLKCCEDFNICEILKIFLWYFSNLCFLNVIFLLSPRVLAVFDPTQLI